MGRTKQRAGAQASRRRSSQDGFARRLRRAISDSNGMVSLASLAKDSGMSFATAFKVAHANPDIPGRMERANLDHVAGLCLRDALRFLGRASPGSRSPAVMDALHARLDAALVDALAGVDGIPSAKALARWLNQEYGTRFSPSAVRNRLAARPNFAATVNRSTQRAIRTMTLAQVSALLRNGSAVRYLDPAVKAKLFERLDDAIARAIRQDPGGPTLRGVVAALGALEPSAFLDRTRLKARLAANEQLRGLYQAEGRRRIETMNDSELRERITRKGGMRVSEDLEGVANERIQRYFEDVIQGSDAILTPHELARLAGLHSPSRLKRDLERSQRLRAALDRRHGALIAAMSPSAVAHTRLRALDLRNLSVANRRALERRFVQVVETAIEADEGQPSTYRTARALGVPEVEFSRALEESPRLSRYLEARSRRWFKALDVRQALSLLRRKATHLTVEERARLFRVLDRHLVETVARMEDPGRADLAAAAGVGRTFVTERLAASTPVYRAFWRSRGLTDDQIIERFLGHPITPALSDLMDERLRHLHAYREMRAVARVLRAELKGDILELSLYPAPLTAVAEDTGTIDPRDVQFRSLEPYRRHEPVQLPRANTLVLQGAHRLPSRVLTVVLRAAFLALKRGGRLVVTHRSAFRVTARARQAIAATGFRLIEEGEVQFEASGPVGLESAGLGPRQAKRVQLKVGGTAGILVLGKGRAASRPPAVPAFRRDHDRCTPIRTGRRARTLNVPAMVHDALRFRFTSSTIKASSAPFLVELTRRGRILIVLAFGANPGPIQRAEYAIFHGAPADLDYHAWARRLTGDADLRHRLLRGRSEARVTLTRFRDLVSPR